MTHLDPVMLQALQAAMPPKLSSAERPVIQKKIESLIATLHPDGYEAAEILDALERAIETRYDNKLSCLDTLEERYKKLRAAYEGIMDSTEGAANDQYA